MKRAKMDLASLVESVERWRQGRAHVREAAPEELWDAAVEVARREGVYATAKAIRFDSSRLKARMGKASISVSRADAAPFVAIEIPAPAALASTNETVVELIGRHGDRMRIVVAAGGVDVVGLAQAFWSRAS